MTEGPIRRARGWSAPARLAACLAVAALALAVWGCDSPPPPEPPEPTPGVSDTEIRVGTSSALTGHASYLGIQTMRGAMACINHVNEEGGVHGRSIRIISYDDAYNPALCLINTQRLIVEHDVFCLFNYVGTPTTVKIISVIGDADIPLIGMFTGANALRHPFNRNLINIRASYYQETMEAVRRFVGGLGLERVAVFYQYDAYGFDGLKGTELALQEYGLAPVATGSYIRGTVDVEHGLRRIEAADAQVVFMIGTYEPCAKFIHEAREQGYDPVFYCVSFVGAEELARRLDDEDGRKVFVTKVVPPPDSPMSRTLLWGAGDFVELFRQYYPDDTPNSVALEGYINARVLVEGLRRAGRDLTRGKFISAIESIDRFSLGIANTLDFGPNDHQGFDRVYFTRYLNGNFRLITDWDRVRGELGLPAGAP